eukprot:COSAG01_NODE_11928_length_1834_cov_1.332565_1_plen_28_part_10
MRTAATLAQERADPAAMPAALLYWPVLL